MEQGHYYLGNHGQDTEAAEPVHRRSLRLGQGSFLVSFLRAVRLLLADLPARHRDAHARGGGPHLRQRLSRYTLAL